MSTPHPAPTPVERVSPVDAEALLREGKGLAVDVRSMELYADGHILGAVSVPIRDLSKHLAQLPRDKILIFY